MSITIRRILESDKTWMKELIRKRWHDKFIVTLRNIHTVEDLDGFIAQEKQRNVGLITFRIIKKSLEIITINSLIPHKGVGQKLITKIVEFARKEKIIRIWLITTNDNIKAIDFYKKLGFVIRKVHKNAIKYDRKLKPSIPLTGENGIPIIDEIEFEMIL